MSNTIMNILFYSVRIISIGHKILLRQHEDVTLTCQYGISVDSKQYRKNVKENKKNGFENNLKRKWYKGSQEMASKRERYLIQNVQPDDSGNYTCMVVNTDETYKERITYKLLVIG